VISLFKFSRKSEIPFSLTLRFSKNKELLTGFATTSNVLVFALVCTNFLARIFKTAAKAGKI
jgi:hypothetical protein